MFVEWQLSCVTAVNMCCWCGSVKFIQSAGSHTFALILKEQEEALIEETHIMLHGDIFKFHFQVAKAQGIIH